MRTWVLAGVAGTLALAGVEAAAQVVIAEPPLSGPTPVAEVPLDEKQSGRCSAENLGDCLNGVGSGVTSLDHLRVGGTPARRGGGDTAAGDPQVAMRPGQVRGMAAGGGILAGYTLWGSYAYSNYESTTRLGAYEGGSENLLLGVDRFWGDRFLVGVALGYEDTDNDTTFNAGEQERDGFSFAPYALYLVNDVLSVDASVGYARIDTDQQRLNTTNGALITSDFEADRAFGTINLNAVYPTGNWVFGGRLGLLHAVESQDAYVETDSGPAAASQARSVGDRHVDLTQGYLSLDAAYAFGEVEPYALAAYYRDISRDDGRTAGGLPGGVVTQPNDRTEFQYGLGVRYYGAGVSGSLEWLTTNGRENFDNDTFSVNVRIDF